MIKFISLFTLICFFITNIGGYAFANGSFTIPKSLKNNETIQQIITNEDVFSKYGQIIYSSYKKNTPLVVMINDLHNNFAAQQNIEQIISFFNKNSNLKKIILEGAPNKKLNTNLFSTIDGSALPDIVESMLSSGNMSGAESFIIKNKEISSFGLENWDLYIENIKKNVILKRRYYNDVSYLLNYFAKSKISYPKTELISTLTYTNETTQRVNKIIEFCNKHNIDLTLYPQLKNVETITKYKNSKNIKKDFDGLLADIKTKTNYNTYSYILGLLKDLETDPKYVMTTIFKIIKESSPELLSKYSSLLTYLQNIKQQNLMNYYILFNELDCIEQYILDKFANEDEKEFLEADKFIYLLSEYSNLSLTYKNYEYLNKNKNYLYPKLTKYLDFKSLEIADTILNDTELAQYYKVNSQRNDIFYNNLVNLLNLKTVNAVKEDKNILNNLKELESVNIVVVGGFHSKLGDMLKQSPVSVLSVVPNVTAITAKDNEMLRVNDIVYQNALASPIINARTDTYSLAFIINSWINIMDKHDISLTQKENIISSWLTKNNINVKFEITADNKILLNSVSADEILKNTDNETKPLEIKHKKLYNFLWSLNNLKLKIYSYLSVLNTLKEIKKILKVKDSDVNTSKNLIEENFIKTEYQKTVDALNGKMPDVILITIDKDLSDEDFAFCKSKIEELLKDKDVKVEYIYKQTVGSAIGFVNAMDYLRNNSDFNKSYDKLNSVIIDIEKEDIELIKKELPLKLQNQHLTALELAVLNGIRSCNKFEDNGGIAFMDARSVYIGAMNITGDLTFISSMVNMEEIEKNNLSLIIKDDTVRDSIEKFYYGFKPDDITDVIEKRGIATKNFYNFNNRQLKQFEVITGNMLIHFDDTARYKAFFDYVLDIKPVMEKSTERMSILKHIFKPYLMLTTNENHKVYLARNTDMSTQTQRDYFEFFTDEQAKFYKENEQVLSNTKFGAYNHPFSLYARNSTETTFKTLSAILSSNSAETDSVITKKTRTSKLLLTPEQKLSNDSNLIKTYEMLIQLNTSTFNSKKDYDRVVDVLMEVFRTTYFQNELYTVEGENTAKLYRLISDTITNSINSLNEQIALNGENTAYVKDLDNLKNSFLSMQAYTIEYLRMLDYTTTFSTLCGYIFPKNSMFEKTKIMPINRRIFGFTAGIKHTEADIRKQMLKVYSLGNLLIDSLYPYNSFKENIDEFIENSKNPKEKTAIGMQKGWGTRRAIQRFSSIITAIQLAIVTACVELVRAPFSMSIIVTSAKFIFTGLGPSFLLHRLSIGLGRNNSFYNKKKRELNAELKNKEALKNSLQNFIYDDESFNDLSMLLSQLSLDKSLNNQILQLIQENKKLIKSYNESSVLSDISVILGNCKEIIALLPNDNSLKQSLIDITNKYSQSLNDLKIDYNPFDKKTKFVTNKEIRKHKLEATLKQWKSLIETDTLTQENLNEIINNAMEVIKLTSFDKKSLKGKHKDELIDTLQDVISFYNTTIDLYEKLPEETKENLKNEIELLNKIGKYSVYYYKSLNYLVTLETLYVYRISKGSKMHFLETLQIMPAIRSLFGINAGIYLSKRSLIKTMKEVKKLGNEITEGGLYNDDFEGNINYFIETKSDPKYFDLGINESWRARKMLSRLVPTILFINKLCMLLFTPAVSLGSMTVSFVTGLGLTMFLHWLPILSGLYQTMIIKEKEHSATSSQDRNVLDIQKSLSKKYLENLSRVPFGQMPDLILVVGNKQQYNSKESMETVLNGMSDKGNFKDVPVEISVTENNGDGNSLIHAFNLITGSYAGLAAKYPSLANKKPEELNVVILNIDGAEQEEILKPLDVEITNKQTSAVEITLLNAVGMLQNNKNKKGNVVVADPSYIYLGTLAQEDNITILGTDTSYGQVKEQHLPLLVANDDNKGIYKIFDKFNADKINNTVVRESYNQRYDIDNSSLTKLPVYSGLIGINLNNIQIFQFLELANRYIETYNGKKPSIDFIAHILIPMLRIINNENMNSYLEKLKEGIKDTETRKEYDTFFRGLFNEYEKFLSTADFNSVFNLKLEHSSVMTKVQNDDFYNGFVSYLQSVQTPNTDEDMEIFDISEQQKNYDNVSFVAEIDFDSYTYEQLEKVLDMLPVNKVIITNIYSKDNPTLFNTESVDIDITDKQFYENPEKENEYKQQVASTKYQKMLELLREKGIELIDESKDNNYQHLNLYNENIADSLSAVSNDSNENIEVLIDISDLFKDVTVYNGFVQLTGLFGGTEEEGEFEVTDVVEFIDRDSLEGVSIEKINKLLAAA